jgi:hypothetical protein
MSITTEAPALSYDAELIAGAQAVFTRARGLDWPEDSRKAIGTVVYDLAKLLKAYHDLRNGIVPPWFPGMLAGHEGFMQALRFAAEDAAERASDLVEVLPAAAEGEAL